MRSDFAITSNLLQALEDAKAVQSRALSEISSGRRVTNPSDDPSASAAVIRNSSAQSQDDSYVAGDAGLRSGFASADSALSNAVQVTTRAVSLAVEGANGTLSASDKIAIAQELTGIQDQLIALANTQFEGKYLFAGQKNNQPAFTTDGSGNVQYQGSSAVASIAIGQGVTSGAGVTGDKLFGANGSNIFEALANTISVLNSNGDVTASVTALQSSLSNLSAQRVFYGTAMNSIDGVTKSFTTEKQNLSDREDQLVGTDMTKAVTDLTQATTVQGAVTAAFSKISQLSLLDYLNPPTGG
jgi:flagellar hook-associated protein 3 FlgL